MDPSSNQAAGIQLPPPVPQSPTNAATSIPQPASSNTGQAGITQQQTAPQIQAQTQVQAQPAPGVATTAALTASNDKDLIEKEWVNRAKAIVARTHSDPYKQSEELTLIKADYLKKRYNKVIKLK